MKHIIGTLFAIGLAGVAAIAATTAFLNSPLSIGPATNTPAATSPAGPAAPPTEAPGKTAAPEEGAKPPPPGGAPQATPQGAGAPAAEGEKPEEDDKDPYEGINPEELPPDLQYDADSSVSFPTNI